RSQHHLSRCATPPFPRGLFHQPHLQTITLPDRSACHPAAVSLFVSLFAPRLAGRSFIFRARLRNPLCRKKEKRQKRKFNNLGFRCRTTRTFFFRVTSFYRQATANGGIGAATRSPSSHYCHCSAHARRSSTAATATATATAANGTWCCDWTRSCRTALALSVTS
ncbi:hypothetical protein PUNSTDRAFT_121012, partial [Punctularia strigosozonata HHB-11173 SS5]|uniref:uncharacterized protein n=1 Tax=Punctularia strigosozonata (strain HHB-11173) TaxID=741275 RepID=UPI0004417B28